jgi:hypothetical protein
MKLILVLSTFFLVQTCFAREEYQLGVVLGAPTGISAKMGLGNNRSIDGVLAYSLASDLTLEFHADYLIENAHAFHINAPSPIMLYFGIGGRIAVIDKGRHDGDLSIGPRVPIGLNYKMVNPNLEFFGELALDMDVVPDTNADLEAGLGLRYRF